MRSNSVVTHINKPIQYACFFAFINTPDLINSYNVLKVAIPISLNLNMIFFSKPLTKKEISKTCYEFKVLDNYSYYLTIGSKSKPDLKNHHLTIYPYQNYYLYFYLYFYLFL